MLANIKMLREFDSELKAEQEQARNVTHSCYDYDLQCWVVSGRVSECGHPDKIQGCFACSHAGEKA